jgi:sigma-B regulation protein RsbU (phosphoserine phosphatase)
LPPHDTIDSAADHVEKLRFVGEMAARLAGAEDPLACLEAALPEIAASLGVERCRLRRLRSDNNNDQAGAKAMAIVGPDGRPEALIEPAISDQSPAADDQQAEFLLTLARLTSMALAKTRLAEKLSAHDHFGHDLEGAAELQQRLQPNSLPDDLPIWGVNLPARQLSGDFFDFFRLDDERIAFTLGDVSGKGLNAALLMAKTVSLFRCLSKLIDTPAELLISINAELCETATRGMFVTMVAGHYYPRSGRLSFANGGHLPPLLRRPDRSYQTFPAAAPPLGILPSILLANEELDLAGGEFYIFTDGLTEYSYSSGEELGVEGIIQLFEVFEKESPARRLELLLETLEHETGWEARDDLTALVIDDAWVQSLAMTGTAGRKEASR